MNPQSTDEPAGAPMNPGEVHALVAEVLRIDIGRVNGDLAFGELPEWDSLNHVKLMVALEERLGVEIEPEQIVELSSVAAIEDFTGAQQEISALVSDGDRARFLLRSTSSG
jgi:acyl carrier protein